MRLGWKCIYAARNPNLQRENWFNAEKVCIKWSQFQLKLRSCGFDVNHFSPHLPFSANPPQSIMPSPPTQGRRIFMFSSSPFIKDCFQKRHLLAVLSGRARMSVTVSSLLWIFPCLASSLNVEWKVVTWWGRAGVWRHTMRCGSMSRDRRITESCVTWNTSLLSLDTLIWPVGMIRSDRAISQGVSSKENFLTRSSD